SMYSSHCWRVRGMAHCRSGARAATAERSGKGGAPGRRLKTLWRRTGAPPFPRERPFGAETSGIRIQEVAGEFAARAPLLQGAVDGFAEQGGVVGAVVEAHHLQPCGVRAFEQVEG